MKCPFFEGFARKTLIRYWKGERVSFNWRAKEKGPPFQRCACLCLEACVRKCVCVMGMCSRDVYTLIEPCLHCRPALSRTALQTSALMTRTSGRSGPKRLNLISMS